MMPAVIRVIVVVLLWLLVPAGVAAAASLEALPTVILLSLDGVRHDYLDRGAGKLPALTRIARQGARAEALVPVFPSSTFPNHVTLATGTHPDRHGIVANRFFDRQREPGDFDYANDASWIEAEPLWVAAERQGVRAASFFWVGSETDWRGAGASHRRAPFDSGVAESEKVDQILAWLDLPTTERPRLVLSWWHGADSAGHRFGPDAPETLRQLAGQDRELGRLLKGLDARGAWAATTLLVVSDHGMASLAPGERIDARKVLRERGIGARVIPAGGLAHVFLEDASHGKLAREALAALPGVRAYPGDALPAELRYAHPHRTGDLVAVTDPPRYFGSSRLLRRLEPRGGHGYEPSHPSMAGVFLALGRAVRPGLRLGRVRALDVAATAAALLGIDPPRQSEGNSILPPAP